jgi:hypothetical protein
VLAVLLAKRLPEIAAADHVEGEGCEYENTSQTVDEPNNSSFNGGHFGV